MTTTTPQEFAYYLASHSDKHPSIWYPNVLHDARQYTLAGIVDSAISSVDAIMPMQKFYYGFREMANILEYLIKMDISQWRQYVGEQISQNNPYMISLLKSSNDGRFNINEDLDIYNVDQMEECRLNFFFNVCMCISRFIQSIYEKDKDNISLILDDRIEQEEYMNFYNTVFSVFTTQYMSPNMLKKHIRNIKNKTKSEERNSENRFQEVDESSRSIKNEKFIKSCSEIYFGYLIQYIQNINILCSQKLNVLVYEYENKKSTLSLGSDKSIGPGIGAKDVFRRRGGSKTKRQRKQRRRKQKSKRKRN